MDQLMISGPGFPGTNEMLKFFADRDTKPLEGVGRAFGSNVILSGIYSWVIGFPGQPASASDGLILYQGELLPFEGGPFGSEVVIIEEVTEQGYDTSGTGDFTNIMPVWKKRYAKFGTMAEQNAVESFPFSNLKRLPSIEALDYRKLQVVRKGEVHFEHTGVGSPVAYCTGNLTGAWASLPNAGGETIIIVDFPQIVGDYFVVIEQHNYQNWNGQSQLGMLSKQSDQLHLSFLHDSNINSGYNQKASIYIIQ